jgi:uncharacterized protein YkwD
VGVDEPLPPARSSSGAVHGADTGPDAVAGAMLDLVNAARAEAKLDPLAADDALAAVARAHAADMEANHYFAHVSPTTGDVADRLRRAKLRWRVFGENLAAGASAEDMHRGLMGSPGHRANILEPRFTNVGIGIVVSGSGSAASLIAVCVFAHESRVSDDAWSTSTVAAINDVRGRRSIAALVVDPALARAARAGAEALADSPGDEVSAMSATRASLASSADGACVELVSSEDEGGGFEPPHMVFNSAVARVGVAAVKPASGKGPVRAFFVYVGSGLSCR